MFQMEHNVFENYPLKVNLDAVSLELESEHFSEYEECVNDCNNLLLAFSENLSEISGKEFEVGWEANPDRMKNAPHITKEWNSEEIVHVFLFEKDNKEMYVAYLNGINSKIQFRPSREQKNCISESHTVSILVKGQGLGRETAIRAVQNAGLEVTSITDITSVPHNGCRPPKKRRV